MRPRSRRCVLLFAHAPRAEARRKGLPAAEPLFRGAQQRLLRLVARLPGVDLVRCAPGAGAGRWLRQRGIGFADRIANAFADTRALGYDEIVAIPGDVPGLDEGRIARAFALLRETPVVLGPSPDGGVYLIGCRGPADALLDRVRWCTPHVRRDLESRTPDAAMLGPCADVDRPADLARVRHDDRVPPELRALVAGAPVPARTLADHPGQLRSRVPASPDGPRGPPLLGC